MLFSLVFMLGLLALWLLLAAGDVGSLILGIPSIALAWWAYRLQRPSHASNLSFSPLGAVRFLAFFLWESMRGGLDVATRVWKPRMPITPAFVEYPLMFPDGPIRAVFLYTVSLLPGTLSVVADKQGRLQVHTLDVSSDLHGELAKLEKRICDLFALPCSQESTC